MRLPIIGALGVCLAAALAAPPAAPARPSPLPSNGGYREVRVAASDTLRLRVRPGEPVVVALPARHDGRPAEYALLRAPALSWLVDRSFYWRTLPAESGAMPVLFRRRAGAEADTLVLLVEIAPNG